MNWERTTEPLPELPGGSRSAAAEAASRATVKLKKKHPVKKVPEGEEPPPPPPPWEPQPDDANRRALTQPQCEEKQPLVTEKTRDKRTSRDVWEPNLGVIFSAETSPCLCHFLLFKPSGSFWFFFFCFFFVCVCKCSNVVVFRAWATETEGAAQRDWGISPTGRETKHLRSRLNTGFEAFFSPSPLPSH